METPYAFDMSETFRGARLLGVRSLLDPPATMSPYIAGDHVYADSFGNLVIHSPAGYKRIIVGEGHLAKELSDFTSAGRRRSSTSTRPIASRTPTDATARQGWSRAEATCTASTRARSRCRVAPAADAAASRAGDQP